MASRIARNGKTAFFVDGECLPQTIAVLKTRAAPLGWTIVVGDPSTDLDPAEVFGAIFQYPGVCGAIHDFSEVIARLHEAGAVAVMAADPLALTLLKPPGEMGADIAIGSMQRYGVPMGYGGPHAAYLSTREAHKRTLPGRLVGVSVDARGNRAYRLALQTREQHIRREKATSNICTAQVLLAVIAGMYAVFHGPRGLKAIAARVHRDAVRLAEGLEALGFTVEPKGFFDTITVEVGAFQGLILQNAVKNGINLRKVGSDRIGITVDERTRPDIVQAVWRAFGGEGLSYDEAWPAQRLPEANLRTSAYLTHPIFHMNRAESEMTRYMRRLADRDLALDRAMIPLGSCTMKLNATAEMLPISWPEFSEIHPFVPADQAEGYQELLRDFSDKLCAITGYDAISMQPNSGAQGEYAGLLAIRAYHLSRGEGHRKVCLIPSSAHGTNPASAQMCGMSVVVVGADQHGNIDVEDFSRKAELHGENLAACMITYPSTHGVFEVRVREICDIVHAHGGQVYLDGANLNAMVGLARPGDIGADVSHLNLHKTFCIPHGGGGPGMGPIGVKAHLIPFLPSDPRSGEEGAVSAAPYGSASILPISWSYCPADGRARPDPGDPHRHPQCQLHRQPPERAPFRCCIPARRGGWPTNASSTCGPSRRAAGVSVDDIAKRLIDCGFHPPTMSWPVAGTLMIEPTESETKGEIDRFCDAILAIREEIRAIEDGLMDKVDNPLKHAPHTVRDLIGPWERPYSREAACFPSGSLGMDKYWPPINRVDNAYGDRNLVCSCPPVDAYSEAAE